MQRSTLNLREVPLKIEMKDACPRCGAVMRPRTWVLDGPQSVRAEYVCTRCGRQRRCWFDRLSVCGRRWKGVCSNAEAPV